MKPVNILLLVLAGALGGAVIMKVAQRPKPAAPAAAVAVKSPAPVKIAEQPPEPAKPTPMPAAAPPAIQTAPAPSVTAPAETAAEPMKKPAREKPHKQEAAKRWTHPGRTMVAAAAPPPAPATHPAPVVTVPEGEPAPAAQADPTPASPAEQPPAATADPPARVEVENPTPAPPPVPQPNSVTLNAGMLISVRLVDGLSTQRNVPGDVFTATLEHEVAADGFVIAERGARVDGRVVSVDRGSRTSGGAALTVELTSLRTSDGQIVPIATESFVERSEPNRGEDVAKIAGGAAIGAIIGALAGGGKGAAIGAGAGGGAGAGDVLLTRKPARLPSETHLEFRLKNAVKVTERHG
jgi:type IV secretory pathway VirB10-like protein